MKFIDEVEITVSSGHGGPGCVSFRRESKVPRGGPDGGDGGLGGNVIFKANSRLHSLLDLKFKRIYKAGNGLPGGSSNSSGNNGKDAIIQVPLGTIIRDENGNRIVDFSEEQEMVFLKGGLGGKGNTFYKTSVNQAPQHAQKGLPGEESKLMLELKLLADVGIIGFPNVGKSTLISRISAAKPKVADYPFTTLVPNLGVVKYGEENSFVVADIPGIIVGASEGLGLGIQFLKHIERTKVFVHVIDISEMTQRDPLQDFVEINSEIEKYDINNKDKEGYFPLGGRPQIVVINKIDTVEEERLNEITEKFAEKNIKVLPVSAVSGKNIQELIYKMGAQVFGSEHD